MSSYFFSVAVYIDDLKRLFLSLTMDEMKKLAHSPENLINFCEHGFATELEYGPCNVTRYQGGYEQVYSVDRSVHNWENSLPNLTSLAATNIPDLLFLQLKSVLKNKNKNKKTIPVDN